MPRQSIDRARQYGIRRREWDRRTAHGYIRNTLLRLMRERQQGQNDPFATKTLSVTKLKALHLIEARGMAQKYPHHTDRLSVTRYITRVDIVSTWILHPANAVAGLYISRSQTQITKRKEANRRAQIGDQSKNIFWRKAY